MHTISWTATDSAGHTDGLGSRYFAVLNNGGVAAPAETAIQTADWLATRSIQLQELDPIQVEVGARDGFLIVNGERRPLPIGSTLKDRVFYWQPGPGFLGEYQLLFEHASGRPVRVNVTIRPLAVH